MNIDLQQFSHELAQEVHAVLFGDQAGFHKSKQLKLPDNIMIIPLHAYWAELNPVENLSHVKGGAKPRQGYNRTDMERPLSSHNIRLVFVFFTFFYDTSKCRLLRR
jgi:hypothetical protein